MPSIKLSAIILVIILKILGVTEIIKFLCWFHCNELWSDLQSWAFYSPLSFTGIYFFTLLLLQRWDSWKGPSGVFLTSIITVELQGVTTWIHSISQLKKTPPNTWPCVNVETSKSDWLRREVGNIGIDCFLPRSQIKNVSFHFSFLPLPSFFKFIHDSSLHLVPFSSLEW